MRDDFTTHGKITLAQRAGTICSNPACRKSTSGPQEDPSRAVNIGVAAHITAAAAGGPRYNPTLSPEQRSAIANGIWLCQSCAKLIDSDTNRYTDKLLHSWKGQREEGARQGVEGTSQRLPAATISLTYELVGMDKPVQPERHEYQLSIAIENVGTSVIRNYHLSLTFPTAALDPNGHANAFHIASRSNERSSFFRFAWERAGDDAYPGDTKTLFRLNYYMNSRLYWNRRALFQDVVRAELYTDEGLIASYETVFETLQNF